MNYVLALFLPPLSILFAGRPFVAVITFLIWLPAVIFSGGLGHPIFILLAWILIYQSREDRRVAPRLSQCGGRPRTRFAPSPTGRLHLGHAFSALTAAAIAAEAGGVFLLRIEDIDTTRARPAFEDDPRRSALARPGLAGAGAAAIRASRAIARRSTG